MRWAEHFFELHGRKSNWSTELLAGLSTFLALSYIFVVNPAILSQAGIDVSAVLFATVVASALATLAMGFIARLPFVLAPGMEMNAYVAFFVVGTLGLTWQQALGAVFWSGVLFLILTVTRIRAKIIQAIPDRMKAALSMSVGVFLAMVALKIAGVLRYDGLRFTGFGAIGSPEAIALAASLAIVLTLDWLGIKAAVLISIVAVSIAWALLKLPQGQQLHPSLNSKVFAAVGQLDFGVVLHPKALSVILVLFLIDFFGSVAKFIGLSMNTSLMYDGKIPRFNQSLFVDGAATLVGSSLGTSTILVYVESGVGIGVGGRTGITAIACGLLMLLAFPLAPLLRYVPVAATTGALCFVAYKLVPHRSELRGYAWYDVLVIVSMTVTVIYTFAIDRAMLAGFIACIFTDLLRRRMPNPYLMASTIALVVVILLQ